MLTVKVGITLACKSRNLFIGRDGGRGWSRSLSGLITLFLINH